MKINIKSEEHRLRLWLPTRLIFSKTMARLGGKYVMRYTGAATGNISPEAIEILFAEFRRIKAKSKNWELVNIEGQDGSIVNISL